MSLTNIAAYFENQQLPDAVLAMSQTGEDRFTAIYTKVSREMQEDLSFLKREALFSAFMLRENKDPLYWTHLALNYIHMLHTKIEILERLVHFTDLLEPNKSLETILCFCKQDKHEEVVRSLLFSLPDNQRTGFCKDLEAFFFCFESPAEAVNIMNWVQEYPMNERVKLARAIMDLFGTKKKLCAMFLEPLIPNIYMLLNNSEKLQEVRLQCQSFEEIQTMLTK